MDPPARLGRRGLWLACTLVAFYGIGVFDHSLWTPDEPRVASVARSAAEGAWVAPTLNGVPFLEQPPLFYWLAALFFRLFGVDAPYLARSISTVLCLGGIWWTHCLARDLVGGRHAGRVGALAAITLALSFEYFHTAHRLVVDSALVGFTTASAYGCLRAALTTNLYRLRLWVAAAAFAATLAFLSKGLIGLAVPMLFAAALSATLRQPWKLLRPAAWIGPPIFLAVTGPWLWQLYHTAGADAFRQLLVDNTLARVFPFLAGERAHVRPVYYYLRMPLHLLPGLFLIVSGFQHRLSRSQPPTPRERFAYDTALLWALAGFLMLTLASTKREVYFIPFFPALAILGGIGANAYLQGRRPVSPRFGVFLVGLLFVAAAAITLAPLFLPATPPVTSSIAGAMGLVLARVCWVGGRRGDPRQALFSWVLGWIVVFVGATGAAVAIMEPAKSLGPVAREIVRQVPEGTPLHAYSPDQTTLAFIPLYTGKPLTVLASKKDVEAALERGETLYVLAVDKTYRTRKRRFEAIEAFGPEVLLQDDRQLSRAFRLYRLTPE